MFQKNPVPKSKKRHKTFSIFYCNNTNKYSELTPLTSKTARRVLNMKKRRRKPLSQQISGAMCLCYDCDDDWPSGFDASFDDGAAVPFECSKCDELNGTKR